MPLETRDLTIFLADCTYDLFKYSFEYHINLREDLLCNVCMKALLILKQEMITLETKFILKLPMQDSRGNQVLTQRDRIYRRHIRCRGDIDMMTVPLIAIYESLIPPEEEKEKQRQLITSLEKLVVKEWPRARLCLFGSCANSFGVSNSDIDVCLVLRDADIDKSEIILKLADILQSANLQNVQVFRLFTIQNLLLG